MSLGTPHKRWLNTLSQRNLRELSNVNIKLRLKPEARDFACFCSANNKRYQFSNNDNNLETVNDAQ